jgi:methyl coenzyme M reductase subunit C
LNNWIHQRRLPSKTDKEYAEHIRTKKSFLETTCRHQASTGRDTLGVGRATDVEVVVKALSQGLDHVHKPICIIWGHGKKEKVRGICQIEKLNTTIVCNASASRARESPMRDFQAVKLLHVYTTLEVINVVVGWVVQTLVPWTRKFHHTCVKGAVPCFHGRLS